MTPGIPIEGPPDDRLERMLADPENYWAEAHRRAREMVERDMARDEERRRQRKRVSRRRAYRRWLTRLGMTRGI